MDGNTKIWRYMDMGGFISLIVNESIYFPCAASFHDPFEGYVPKSHTDAMIGISKDVFAPFLKQAADRFKNKMGIELAKEIPDWKALHALGIEEVKRKNGVSCWHINNYESEAMWKIYGDKGIAIESTVNQLQNSLPNEFKGNKIHYCPIEYEDYENAEIKMGREHYMLAIKRKSFEHEKEFRAIVSLPVDGQGIHIPCNLDSLISQIHISPLSRHSIKEDLEKLCQMLPKPLRKSINKSSLYELIP